MPENGWYSGIGKRHREFANAAERLSDPKTYGLKDIGTIGVQLDTGREYILVALTGPRKWVPTPTLGFTSISFKTPSGNGAELTPDDAAIVAGSGLGDPGNPSYFLPPGSELLVGAAFPALFSMSVPGETATITMQGGDMFVTGGSTYVVEEDVQIVTFVHIGNAGGALPFNAWLAYKFQVPGITVTPEDFGLTRQSGQMTLHPLPPFTVSGDGEIGTTLTATSNGALGGSIFDATTPGTGEIVIVAHEQGANRRWHGLYKLTQGDGSNPWSLRVEDAWAQPQSVYGAFGAVLYANGAGQSIRARGTWLDFFGKANTGAGGGAEKDRIIYGDDHIHYVRHITAQPLPSYVSNGGTESGETLTGTVNGALVINEGITPFLGSLMLVAAETDKTKNAIWRVEQVGDGSNPYIIRRWWKFTLPDDGEGGALVLNIQSEASSIGRGLLYAWRGGAPGGAGAQSFYYVGGQTRSYGAPQITAADTTGYNPPAWAIAQVVTLNTDGDAYNLHGALDANPDDHEYVIARKTLVNIGNFDIVIKHQSATETDSDKRFYCPSEQDMVLPKQGGTLEIIYDTTQLRWRVFGDHKNVVASPAQITADQTAYNPALFATADIVRLNSDASRNIHGILAPPVGRHGPTRKRIYNVGNTDIVLKHESVTETTAANRLLCFTGADITLQQDDNIEIWYDPFGTLRWRVG